MHRKEKAIELFSNRCNCSQAVFAAFRQAEVLDEASALRLATVFGGGCVGSGGGMCGAVTGALMVLSMRYGMGGIEELANKSKTYELGRQFMAEFERRMGSCQCESILGLCIGEPENLQKARELKLFETVCVDAVATASDILEEMLCAEG
ncbi:C-GCAxxG-C-C family protein [Chlorobaculum sp. MV4-Y]|jgi:C_GCAxxG_C_C family probable redox protein|uniref:C-GCAxxG-C-C family (seleno)protein n=1 Tax=Chlorobaculum sp. MV4-Y TaxID=2976335 RepID=UPI0021B05E71|nr:C-GCAxxG-C-C family (seleno)protein [Chlorobaculum sp. MV4-Y]UWX57011.1 C-GCAxxG-C-C family protein [Chlorobaculum sp. MV4-Y]